MKIMIGVNTLTAVEQPVYANHIQFFYRLGRHYADQDVTFAIHTPRRMSIDRMRNMTAKLALENDFDYLMFIDDDVVIPIDCLAKMIAADKDIVAGWTIIRGHPFLNMFFKFMDEKKEKLLNYQDYVLNDKGLIECDAVGFSCALIKCSLLKKVAPPWFVTGPYNTEDIYFCMKARQFIPDSTIVVDPSIETYHIIGPEMIGPKNRDLYKIYQEQAYPELTIAEPTEVDRGDEYAKMVENLTETKDIPVGVADTISLSDGVST